ncbi:porin [Comamonas sp.]|uniref:porin n=1 Tax=Comamonas sp. TaxID=34028 RepID=UPI00289EAF06|nr:porin [Comamonas sp.]
MSKHTKVAVAVFLAAMAGGAAAQSNVAIYGTIDTGLGRTYTDAANANMVTSYDSTTLFGFRGSEDLGNGLKVNFQLEADGVKSDTGAWDGGFKRQSWVGLSGGFGEVMLGRTTTPQNRLMGVFDLNGTADGSSALKVLGLAANGSLTSSRQSNQIQYATPKFSGFQARVAYGFSETVSGTAGDKKDFLQLAASYQNGGLTVGAAFQPKSQSTQAAVGATDNRNGFSLGAKYNFGFLEASALYTRSEKTSEGDGWGLGIAAPVGKATRVGVQYARITKHDSSQVKGSNAVELFADYALSKRTSFYANYGRVNSKAEVWKKLERSNTFAVGITHKF